MAALECRCLIVGAGSSGNDRGAHAAGAAGCRRGAPAGGAAAASAAAAATVASEIDSVASTASAAASAAAAPSDTARELGVHTSRWVQVATSVAFDCTQRAFPIMLFSKLTSLLLNTWHKIQGKSNIHEKRRQSRGKTQGKQSNHPSLRKRVSARGRCAALSSRCSVSMRSRRAVSS